ncbi:hypothetical protein DRN73_08995 [Candidatus Pacearchaeota archaeon]|nr:MAG: hypothetical protein DRN73_08995 [Candidatus Pacearchaeota archaeon]
MKHVYEFTNGRELTKKEFIHWFQKKFLYTLRKFKMIQKEDIIGYENKGDFRGVVLEDLLKMLAEKSPVKIIKLPSKKKITKKAIALTSDLESDKIINVLVNKNALELKNLYPVNKKLIQPLYLFLDKEVLIYAKLMNLKFKKVSNKKDKLSQFINDLEKKHPEIKHSIIKSYLELYK